MDPRCEFCKQQPETIGHVLWKFPFARNTWALVRGRLQKCPNKATAFFLLLRGLQERLERGEVEVWVVTAWALWNVRNKFYFEKV